MVFASKRVSEPMAGAYDEAAGVHVDCIAPSRPAWRVELAPGRRIRVVFRDQTLLYARPAPDYSGIALLRGADLRTSPLPPLGGRSSPRAVAGSPEFVQAWCWHFLRLLDAGDGPLHRGTWRLEPAALVPLVPHPPPGHRPVYAPGGKGPSVNWLDPGPRHLESWWLNGSGALLPLRAPSPPEAGRVKTLRKLVRDGRLPPLLLLYVTGLDLNLLVDGHDRLHAALLEGHAPLALVLMPVCYKAWPADPRAAAIEAEVGRNLTHSASEATVQRVNRRLVGAFAVGDWLPRSRAWPVPGGADAWDAGVAARLRTLGPDFGTTLDPGRRGTPESVTPTRARTP